MPSLLIKNAKIFSPDPLPNADWVLIADGKIVQVGSIGSTIPIVEDTLDAEGMFLVPGFIDGHVHGAMGYETMDADPEALVEMSKYYAAHGVTSFVPTTWAVPMETLLPVLGSIKIARKLKHIGANILGAHIESSFICKEKAGAQNPEYIFPATPEMVQTLIEQEIIKIITLAPEIPQNLAVIPSLVKAGIIVAAGHTCANYEDICTAVQYGVKSMTHTFNAMIGLHHRNPGTVGAGLTIDELYTEVIADNIHLHPAILKLVASVKPEERLLLVSDAIRGTGLADGVYPIGDREIMIKEGVARLENGNLAGSTLTLDKALRNMIAATEKPLEAILPALTSNPATLLGVADHKGFIQPTYDADLVLLSHELMVKQTIIGGVLF